MDAEIFDVDGTLCDVSSIRHYVEAPKGQRNFEAFHKAGTTICPPNEWVAQAARDAHAAGRAVLIVSARMAKWGRPTIKWAGEHSIPFTDAWFRPDHDYRADHFVKRDIYRDICRRGYNVVRAYDDNPSIIALWQELGVETIVVPGWPEGVSGVYKHGE